MRSVRLIVCGVAAVVLAAGCAQKYAKVEESFAQPINCATARSDIQDLQNEKVDKATQAAMGAKFALPTTILLGAITGTAGAQSDVSTGAYNQKIDERIANIKEQCKLD